MSREEEIEAIVERVLLFCVGRDFARDWDEAIAENFDRSLCGVEREDLRSMGVLA